jgi:hypothetical protein
MQGDIYAVVRMDGGVSIMTIVQDVIEMEEGSIAIDIADEISKLEASGIAVVNYFKIEERDIPQDRYFRGAWEFDQGLSVNMDKARDIQMGHIRAARNEKLAALDIEQLKGNDVAAEKQTLRDIPETFDLTGAETPEALKELWPEELV